MARVDEPVPSIRPSLAQRARPILIVAAMVGFAFAFAYGWRWYRRHQRRAEIAAMDEADAVDGAIAQKIFARLAPLRRADPATAPPGPCPPAVTGPLALVGKPALDLIVDGGTAEQRLAAASALSSPAFAYLDGSWTPGDPEGAAERHDALVALSTAPFVVVSTGTATPVTAAGSATFEGGSVDADLAIGDLATGRYVCAFHVTSQPLAIVSVRQLGEDPAPGQSRASSDAVTDAFWTAAIGELARVAPRASLIRR